MAGTVTTTEYGVDGGIAKVHFDWLSSSGGAADATTTGYYSGRVIGAVFEPDSGGTQPTTLYDVAVNDADGLDILNGQGANLSNSAAVIKVQEDKLSVCHSTTLTLAVTNAGNAKGGEVTLFIR